MEEFYDVVLGVGTPVLTTTQLVERLDREPSAVVAGLESLVEAGELRRVVPEGDGTDVAADSDDRAEVDSGPDPNSDPHDGDDADDVDGGEASGADRVRDPLGDRPELRRAVWHPTELTDLASRERVILFPERREVVVDNPTQYTRAQLAQFAHLVDTTSERTDGPRERNRGRGYLYRIRQEDVWHAPFEELEELLGSMREVFPRRSPHLEEWVESQWKRAHQFVLYTHEDGYTVLEAANDALDRLQAFEADGRTVIVP